MPEQSSGIVATTRRYSIIGLTTHLAGLALGVVSIGLVAGGVIGMGSGISVLSPFADLMYGLGLVMVVAAASRAGMPMKYLLVAGAVIGVGLFYKSAPHEAHIASGIGFDMVHEAHTMMGIIMIAVSVVAIAVITLAYNRSASRAFKTMS